MKNSIEWHEQCLKNRLVYAEAERDRAMRAMELADRGFKEAEFYARQIDEAKRRGKDGFDSERFMQKAKDF